MMVCNKKERKTGSGQEETAVEKTMMESGKSGRIFR